MIIDLGDSYKLECKVIDKKPSIKLVGDYTTVNCSTGDNVELTYINYGFLNKKLLDRESDIVLKVYDKFELDNKVLISFSVFVKELGCYKTADVYFDLETEEVGHTIT